MLNRDPSVSDRPDDSSQTMTRRENIRTQKTGCGLCLKGFACTVVLLTCAFSTASFAQEMGRRSARSLTSEDLLNRPVIYVPQPSQASSISTASSARLSSSAVATSYRDPSGIFSLSFPNDTWRVNTRAGSGGNFYSQRSFRKIEDEGFASAATNVYVLAQSVNLPLADAARMSTEQQSQLATMLTAHFLSSNVSLVSVEPLYSNGRSVGLRIIADQIISRRAEVRAAITVFERQGRLFVVVCRAPLETFDANAHEFDAITNSLASSVAPS